MSHAPPPEPPADHPRRFSWPMRVFLALFLGGITYRCFAILLPLNAWRDEYDVRTYPMRLSSAGELARESRRATPDNPRPAVKDCVETADSVWGYLKPWPDAKTCERIHTWEDGAKIGACWLNGRLAFAEHLCGIDEGWRMFSPSVGPVNYHTRARLFYDDDSDTVIRQVGEPDDYGRYAHWWREKIMNYETRADESNDTACRGYCNLLAHRHRHNAAGARLVKIVLFQVKVHAPSPGKVYPPEPPDDPAAHYAEQNLLTASPPRRAGAYRSERVGSAAPVCGAASGTTGALAVRTRARVWTPQVMADFYEFDVETRKGQLLKDEP